MSFFKFPRTPHVFVLPGLNIRNDKLLSPEEAALFYKNPVIVEEKVDGANIGISLNKDGELQVQNRGNYIRPGEHPQFDTLWEWIYSRAHLLSDMLADRFILFGEWCYLKHSVSYHSLPDWFIGIDIYDVREGNFFKVKDRNATFLQLNICAVPQVTKGCFSKHQFIELLAHTSSRLGADELEGLYLRLEDNQWLLKRAKIVKSDFIQNITRHWKDEVLQKNKKVY
jgi:ATP-dependent RNA circularization protein (DNA/RNA ligase family)